MSDQQAKSETYDPNTFWVAPARNFRSSARLHLQHHLWQKTVPFLLEPSIESYYIAKTKDVKIADLACGNGAWLIDLHDELASKGRMTPSAQLHGFDINPVNFPPKSHLPYPVTLSKLDILAKELPQELIGVYDVVHIRAFSSIVVNDNTKPLLSVAKAMLKPGGWLQWDESGADFSVQPPMGIKDDDEAAAATTACRTIVGILDAGAAANGLSRKFLNELDRHARESGFEDVWAANFELRRQDMKAWTEDYLMVWEELAAYFPSRQQSPNAPLAREDWVRLFEKAVKETEGGALLFYEKIGMAVGRKPL